MPVRMIASRRFYHKGQSKEYVAGQGFDAVDEREADRFERRKHAKRAMELTTPPVPKAPARMQNRQMRAEPEPTPEPVVQPDPAPTEPEAYGTTGESVESEDGQTQQRRTYRRRDLRSEP